jgi:hypothetical protein
VIGGRLKNTLKIALVMVSMLWLHLASAQTDSPKLSARVPFVGCSSDGQTGPVDAPTGKSRAFPLSAKTALQLAYYQTENGFGVLAPRGWYCFGAYGSAGDTLYVSPQPIDTANLSSSTWTGFRGSAVQMRREYGGTSGRFSVARTIARVFPAHRKFVQSVIKGRVPPAGPFAWGPCPNDKLVYKNNEIVEYETPAQTDGLGTSFSLQKNANPIRGVAILVGEEPDLLHLAIRLPRDMAELTSVIVQQVERDAAELRSGEPAGSN